MSEKPRKVESILISQPQPSSVKNPYTTLADKHGIKIDFRKFIQLERITPKEYRRQKINPLEFQGIILNSKTAIEHYFKICEEVRVKMPQETKYFCSSENIALYLQKFIEFRKRKVFYPKDSKQTLFKLLDKHKGIGKFLYPCASYPFDEHLRNQEIPNFLTEKGIEFSELVIYKVVCSDLSDLSDIFYDMIVFFSPLGIRSLFENFPEFKQNNTRIAAYGKVTAKSVTEHELVLDVKAPDENAPSMSMAIDHYLKRANVDEDQAKK